MLLKPDKSFGMNYKWNKEIYRRIRRLTTTNFRCNKKYEKKSNHCKNMFENFNHICL